MLRERIQEYLRELRALGRSPYTVVNYEKHLAKFASFCEENGIDFRQVNGKESRAFRNRLVEEGLAPKTVNTILGAVRSFYDFLCETGEVKGNPWIMRRLRVKEERRQPDFLTEAELEKVMAAVQRLPYHVGLAFRVMLAAGLRVSEAASLSPEDVRLVEGERVFLRVRHGKGGKERQAPVTDPGVAKEILAVARERAGLPSLFGISAGTLKVYAHQIKKETGISFHCHRLRHTLATRLLNQGFPIDVVQKVLGHADISTTRRYAETLPEAVLRVAAKVAERG